MRGFNPSLRRESLKRESTSVGVDCGETGILHPNSHPVISQPYQFHQESCCYFSLQKLNIPTIVNTSSNFDSSSQQHL
jgi:hypothetical protein